MYAIIRAGGHQEKVTPGDQITVDRMKQDPGAEVTFVPLMISREDGTVISERKQLNDTAKVVGRVVQHLKADKIEVFMYRNKTGYRRHTGHRQPMTLVEIAEIRIGDEVVRAPEPAPEPSAPEAADAGEKPAAPAAPKAKTKAKPAAKSKAKPAAKKTT